MYVKQFWTTIQVQSYTETTILNIRELCWKNYDSWERQLTILNDYNSEQQYKFILTCKQFWTLDNYCLNYMRVEENSWRLHDIMNSDKGHYNYNDENKVRSGWIFIFFAIKKKSP
jgi:hypothetical protein